MPYLNSSCFFSLASGAQTDADKTVYGVLKIDRYDYKDVSPVRYGFHYEEIGKMGEGALHAELVRNRSFEEANPPQGLSVWNGLYGGFNLNCGGCNHDYL